MREGGILESILIFILGIVIGSFLNVCIYRIPMEKSITFPPSHCTNCGHNLKPLDLIPIFSYICLGGRCRYCNEKISVRYPTIEAVNGIIYLLICLKFGLTIIALKYCILGSILIVIGMIDYDTQFVFTNTTVLGGIIGVSFIIIQALIYQNGIIDSVLGGLIGFGSIGLIVFITKGMGEGDIEIAAVCGLFMGIKGILLGLFLAIVMGGVIGIIIIALRLKNAKEKIAFGPCIAIGSLISVLWGSDILRVYCTLFR